MNTRHIVFTKRAFNAIVTETLDRHPLETGGVFIGYILDNGIWVVIETIPPGIETVNQRSYFEYDANFITYLSNVIARQYKGNLQILGLWHRHPGSMDVFSSTDDGTNVMFAKANPLGAISGLINCDPKMRLTMYHVNSQCHYDKIDWSVDDGIIPENLLELRFTGPTEFPVLGNNAASSLTVTNTTSATVETENCLQTEEQTPVAEEEKKDSISAGAAENTPNEPEKPNTLGDKLKKCLKILRNE
ncbi:MAG: Mov34/MPN/PAD-1 family protein [Prevotellaceae bacterium]|nr:Mov34/MPN/PAD-1 family protein [Prevotellaceae bacterium]